MIILCVYCIWNNLLYLIILYVYCILITSLYYTLFFAEPRWSSLSLITWSYWSWQRWRSRWGPCGPFAPSWSPISTRRPRSRRGSATGSFSRTGGEFNSCPAAHPAPPLHPPAACTRPPPSPLGLTAPCALLSTFPSPSFSFINRLSTFTFASLHLHLCIPPPSPLHPSNSCFFLFYFSVHSYLIF